MPLPAQSTSLEDHQHRRAMPDSVGSDALQDDIVGPEHLAPSVFGTSGNITSINGDDAAAAGSSGLVADAAHQHAYTAATPIKVQSTNSEGSGSSNVRDDHGHASVSLDTATRVWTDADTTLSVGSAVVVNFNQESFDDGADFDLTTDMYTVPETGLYEYGVNLLTSATIAETARFVPEVQLNSTTVVTTGPEVVTTVGSVRAGLHLQDQQKFTAGDTLRVRVNQQSGTARNIDGIASRPDINYFWIRRVG